MTFDVDKDLEFKLVERKPKTLVFEVWNTQEATMIGIVKWFSSWRHYCFFPERDTVFSDRCLTWIGEKIEILNTAHKFEEFHLEAYGWIKDNTN